VQVTPINQARFDSLKLVHDQQVVAGAMPVAGFVRLQDSLLHSDGTLAYRVQGTRDRQQRSLLKLQVRGMLQLQCQRCLDGFDFKLDIDTALRLVAPEALDSEYTDDPDEPDCVAASAAFDLAELIEDEVLLALPAYPRHPAGRCTGTVNESGAASAAKITAFSALQALKPKVSQSKE
jgi:uncharacterized protein